MPELPEVETTKNSLTPLLGKKIKAVYAYRDTLRWDIAKNLSVLENSFLVKVTRRAKYLVLYFQKDTQEVSSDKTPYKLIIHLGMSGSLQQDTLTSEKRKHDHVVFEFENIDIKLSYHDPRRFGAILWHDEYADKLFGHLAPEPLSDEFDANYLHAKLQKTSRAIKVAIMDQSMVVGVGNIYATESLFLSKIHPSTKSNLITFTQTQELIMHIKVILIKAIELGGSTLNDFTYASGQTGYFQQTLHVYGRAGEPCVSCEMALENIKITGRASVFCPVCQVIA